jgi:hypothetical protein
MMKEYARALAGLGSVIAAGVAAGGTFETNPTSSDFGKLRFGNLRVDILGGLAQLITFGSRVALGYKTDAKGHKTYLRGPKRVFGQGIDQLGSRFLRSKFNPILGTVVTAASGTDVLGNEVSGREQVMAMFTPLAIRNLIENMQEMGIPRGVAWSLLDLHGLSVQNYEKKRKRKTKSLRAELDSWKK